MKFKNKWKMINSILISLPQSKMDLETQKMTSLISKVAQPLRAGIFPIIFYYCYLVVKNQFIIEFQNSILHLLQFQWLIFHYNCWSAILKTLSIRKSIHYLVFFTLKVFSSSIAGFKYFFEKFLLPFLGHHKGAFSVTNQVNSTYKIQSSRQKLW